MSDRHGTLYDSSGQWRRWELESFDEPAPPADALAPDSAEPDAPALPDPAEVLAEIERLRATAKARGHAEGFAAGHAQGLETGLKEGREQGLAEGREQGLAEGREQGLDTAREEAGKIRELAQACAEAIEQIEAEAGDALISLAVNIARQVLTDTLKREPERILDVVSEVLHVDGSQQGILRLRLNPADIEMVEQYLQQDGSITRWRLQPDMSIDRGGCVAETALGNIDATLQTRWQRVVSTLGAEG